LNASVGGGTIGGPSAGAMMQTPDLMRSLGLMTPSMADAFAGKAGGEGGAAMPTSISTTEMLKLANMFGTSTSKTSTTAIGGGLGSAQATVTAMALMSPGLFFNNNNNNSGIGSAAAGMANSPLPGMDFLMTPAVGAVPSGGQAMLNSPAFQALMRNLQGDAKPVQLSNGAVSAAKPAPISVEQIRAAVFLVQKTEADEGGLPTGTTPTTLHNLSFAQLLKQQAAPFSVVQQPAAPGPALPPLLGGQATIATMRTAPVPSTGRSKAEENDDLLNNGYDAAVLDMPCVLFNQYIKEKGLDKDEIKGLKKARRKKKNRLYAKRSRERKTNKLDTVDTLSNKVVELEAQAAFAQSPAVQAVLAAAGLMGGAMGAGIAAEAAAQGPPPGAFANDGGPTPAVFAVKTDDGHMEITQAGGAI
jgi:hypothetical protein